MKIEKKDVLWGVSYDKLTQMSSFDINNYLLMYQNYLVNHDLNVMYCVNRDELIKSLVVIDTLESELKERCVI